MIPLGLSRCTTCGELKGEFWHKWTADPEASLTPVRCLCDGIPCSTCRKNLIHRPISNRYDEATGKVWHVPYFGYLLPCEECRERENAEAVAAGERPPWSSGPPFCIELSGPVYEFRPDDDPPSDEL
jgi:hypothetical protein